MKRLFAVSFIVLTVLIGLYFFNQFWIHRYDALIALGAVVRGDTYHFEIVSNESCNGITQVQLDSGVPIANGILTTDTDDQALERMAVKGADCAMVAVEMANLLQKI